ncbi:hypothetical protein [Paraburkholderia sabiae]|uniref:hypothetical protein n=1 Tax=Paraburkholderia sabiae TaxID=273251 RepID=UPI001CC4E75C|nr:hypothetical protein [Paraburkholderia sabiae]
MGKPDGLLMFASMRRDTTSVIQCLDEHIYFYLFLPDCLPEMCNLLQRIARVGDFSICVIRRASRLVAIAIDGFPAIEHTVEYQSRHIEASISSRTSLLVYLLSECTLPNRHHGTSSVALEELYA